MNASREPTPHEVLREVTDDLLRRAIRMGRRRGRSIFISKTSRGRAIPVAELDPDTAAGRKRLDSYVTPGTRHFTISGLGDPEEPDAINWRNLSMPLGRRVRLLFLVGISLLMKGTPAKNRLFRRMGAHVGRNVEIMQMVWLDHFRPELIFVGDNTLIGAFSRVTVHAYEGRGRFRYGLVEIGRDCTLGAGTGIGIARVEDGVRTLPGTTVSPYFPRVRAGAVVGYSPPPIRYPGKPAGEGEGTDPPPEA